MAEGAKIDKIQQPGKNEVIISLRGMGMSRRLLVSVASGRARTHFTEMSFENPQSPPMFCMLLRKHLVGARIASITQPSMERVLDFELDVYDEMGVAGKSHLIIELIGVSANLILVSGDGRIIDCLRRVEGDMTEKRSVLPGLFYRLPPASDKKNPLLITKEELSAFWDSVFCEKTVDGWLMDTFLGFSPLVCRELSQRFFGDTTIQISSISAEERASLPKKLIEFFESIKRGEFIPFSLANAGKPFDFSCIPITQYGNKMEKQVFNSFSELLDVFYSNKEQLESAKQRTQTLTKTVKNLRDRRKRKLLNQTEELKASLGRESLRETGDIIKANLYNMKQGMAVLKASDFYSEDGAEVEIKLDARLTPQQNAAKYYKDYNKAKKAEQHLTEQIKTGEIEVEYLESVLDELSRAAGEKDVEEIRRELEKMGYISSKSSGKKVKEIRSKPLRFVSTNGFNISVGKNNTQNDELTFKIADRFDIWLHTQKIHGSHVVIFTEGRQVDDRTIEEAAMLAAFYSQGSEGQKVPVDFTQIKFVKKPSGAKPGMVIYTDYKTVFVNPDKKVVESLQVK
jgi:predicted ribosome quality control (RQC) complex YloA/Tae2 family protein